jgi:hypothetical protein
MMMDQGSESSRDPGVHVDNVQRRLREVVEHIEKDQALLDDVQALALFEVTREVLLGLSKAFEDYRRKNEKAWK